MPTIREDGVTKDMNSVEKAVAAEQKEIFRQGEILNETL
jgi:hypothetical protein